MAKMPIKESLESTPPGGGTQAPAVTPPLETVFGLPRHWLNHRYVYAVISPRAAGLSIGVNMNPDRRCNFDCVYCEVDRTQMTEAQRQQAPEAVDVAVMTRELREMLQWAHEGKFAGLSCYRAAPPELLELREVALSGDGEPTLSPNFSEIVQGVVHLRALGMYPFFKIVMITNATGVDLPEVQRGLQMFTGRDEIWAKLDAGTQAGMDRVNRSQVPLDKVLQNILLLGRKRPIVIQSLFPVIKGEETSEHEVGQYIHCLLELKLGGAQISEVQIYSARRPSIKSDYGHMPLKHLSRLAQQVRKATGLQVEVF